MFYPNQLVFHQLVFQGVVSVLIFGALAAGGSADEPRSLHVKMPRVASVAISPDGKLLATGGSAPSRVQSGLSEGAIKLWELSSGREVASFRQSGRRKRENTVTDSANTVRSLVFSPDGKLLVGGDALGYKVWELSTGKEILALEDGLSYSGPAFSPDGQTFAIPARGVHERRRGVRVMNVATGRELFRLSLDGPGQIHSVAYSPDGNTLATAGIDCKVTLWDLGKRKILFQDEVGWTLHSCCFSPDGLVLIAAGEGGVLKRYEVTRKGDQVQVEKQEDSPRYWDEGTYALEFWPDGNRLLAVGFHRVHVWELAGWREIASRGGRCATVSPIGDMMAIGDANRGMVEIGDARTLLESGIAARR